MVDLTIDRGELCGRLLADLGAEVIKVEPPAGSAARGLAPLHEGVSLFFAVRNAGKKSVALDLDTESGLSQLHELLAHSDVLIQSNELNGSGESGLDPYEIGARHPHLVVTSITNYGLTGPWSGRVATDGVLASTGAIAFKAGVIEKDPLFPPASFVDDGASVSFAFATLAALWQRENDGGGQVLDCSVNEAIANMGDWAVPNTWIREVANQSTPEIRNGAGPLWPSFPCADGFVRVVILAPRQWRAMRAWLGEPEYLQDPELDTMPGRLAIAEVVINPLITELFAGRTMDDIATEAQSRGIVCTPLAKPADVLANEHFKARGSLVDVDLGGGLRGPIPSGFIEVDGERAGPVAGPPGIGEHSSAVFAAIASEEPRTAPSDVPAARAPLAGLRVADFGIGGVGVEVGRMLAEYGAEVLKIESRTYPDFIRLASGGEMSPSFASSSRSKLGFGANAKHPDGNRVLLDLIARCDAVIENNSTGVMAQMGLGYEALRAVNPGIVMCSSQLMGSRGPWADFRGYGPSTRAGGGIEMLWNYDDQDEPAGGSSIFPDHLCGRIGALGIMAALLRRHRSGEGVGCPCRGRPGRGDPRHRRRSAHQGGPRARDGASDRQPSRPRRSVGPFPVRRSRAVGGHYLPRRRRLGRARSSDGLAGVGHRFRAGHVLRSAGARGRGRGGCACVDRRWFPRRHRRHVAGGGRPRGRDDHRAGVHRQRAVPGTGLSGGDRPARCLRRPSTARRPLLLRLPDGPRRDLQGAVGRRAHP